MSSSCEAVGTEARLRRVGTCAAKRAARDARRPDAFWSARITCAGIPLCGQVSGISLGPVTVGGPGYAGLHGHAAP